MARRQNVIYSASATVLVTCGGTDQANLIDMVAPSEGAKVAAYSVTTKTAGTGTGTFTVQLKDVTGTITLTAASTACDADAVPGTVLCTGIGNDAGAGAFGNRLSLTTVKTGTVTDAVVILFVAWAT